MNFKTSKKLDGKVFCFKEFLFIFREGKGGRQRRRETVMCGCLEHPLLGIWPATQACALTGNRTSYISVRTLAFCPLSHTSQGGWKVFKHVFVFASFPSEHTEVKQRLQAASMNSPSHKLQRSVFLGLRRPRSARNAPTSSPGPTSPSRPHSSPQVTSCYGLPCYPRSVESSLSPLEIHGSAPSRTQRSGSLTTWNCERTER